MVGSQRQRIRRARHVIVWVTIVALSGTTSGWALAAPPAPGTLDRISVNAIGEEADGFESWPVSLSQDGCQALIVSDATNLVPDDTNDEYDAFVRDCETGAVERVSVRNDGSETEAGTTHASMSADGTKVAFITNRPPGERQNHLAYVRDRVAGTTTQVPVPMSGDRPGTAPRKVAISGDGKTVAYIGSPDELFIANLALGTFLAVPIGAPGCCPSDLTEGPSAVSYDGRLVVFRTLASLVPDDLNGLSDAYIYDRDSESFELASIGPSGETVTGSASDPSLSSSGRYVVFSAAFAFDGGAPLYGAWIRDRDLGTTRRIDVRPDGGNPTFGASWPSVADNCGVAYESFASDLVAGDDNGTYDIFVWDCATNATRLVSVSNGGQLGNGHSTVPFLTADARFVSFTSDATNLVPGDTTSGSDAFVRNLQAASSDADGDGILDEVDSDPATPSTAFTDGQGTTGVILGTGGLTVQIADAPAPAGIRITVGAGTGTATLSVCGGFQLTIAGGSAVVITCGSLTVEVIAGSAVAILSSDTSLAIPAGAGATITTDTSGRFTVTDVRGTGVVLTIEGTAIPIAAGASYNAAAWSFVGFSPPVDNGGIFNAVKAGQAVPLKWRLLQPDGITPVADLTVASVSVTSATCPGSGSQVDQVEQTVAAGSSLQNLGDGFYQLNWKTAKGHAGSCRRMMLDLGEGITRDALFVFVR